MNITDEYIESVKEEIEIGLKRNSNFGKLAIFSFLTFCLKSSEFAKRLFLNLSIIERIKELLINKSPVYPETATFI